MNDDDDTHAQTAASPNRQRETRAQRRRRKKLAASGSARNENSRPAPSVEELAKRLAICISMPFQRALQASTVTVMTMSAFYQNKTLFRMNPANTLAHAALAALEERSAVEVYEWLSKVGSTFGVSQAVRRQWAELRNHRDHASHRLHESEWDRLEMQQFAKEGRFVRLKTVEIWKATAWIRNHLRPDDRHWLPNSVLLDYGMAMMIDAIYRTSMTAEAIPRIPPVPTIYEGLKPASEKYIRQLDAKARELATPEESAEDGE